MGQRRVGMPIKGPQETALERNCTASSLCQCPHSGCETVLQFCKMLSLGKLGKGTWRISVLFLVTA